MAVVAKGIIVATTNVSGGLCLVDMDFNAARKLADALNTMLDRELV
jgi:hypothetical protein